MKKLKIKITYENLEFCRKFLNKERYKKYNEFWVPDESSINNESYLHYPSPEKDGSCYGANEYHYPDYQIVSTKEFKKAFYDIKDRLKDFKI